MEGVNPTQVNSYKDFPQPSTSQFISRFVQNSELENRSLQSQLNAPAAGKQMIKPEDTSEPSVKQQNIYRQKCILLEPHVQEAALINKALKSELKQYRDKIKFEKKLCKYLVTRIKDIDS